MPPDWPFLVAEVDATAALLRHARAVWRDYSFPAYDAEALMVLLATGSEKLLKLTYGLAYADDHGIWPTYRMFRSYGHDLTRLDAYCRALVKERVDRATSSKVITACLHAVESDQNIPALLATLTTYAKRGRFFNLDHLAGEPQPDSPAEMWDQLVDRDFFSNPRAASLLGRDTETYRRLRVETNQRLVDSQSAWQELYARAWAHGVCGPEAKRFGLMLLPARAA